MASNSRRQIETWLKTIDVSGSVVDVGGLFWPVKGRTKTWNVDIYHIVDVKETRNGVKADYVADINLSMDYSFQHDVGFCIEVTDHLWNPVMAFNNVNLMIKPGGILHISSNFIFPHHTGFDCIRFTRDGISKVLQMTGFEILNIVPRYAVDDTLFQGLKKESKVVYHPNEIGYMVTAQKRWTIPNYLLTKTQKESLSIV